MYIIDLSYFKGNINVPNVEELNSGNAVKLETYIDKYGRLFMQHLLGYELFLDFDSHTENGELKPTAPQIYKDLVDGNGSDFLGLRYTQGLHKHSVIANFVYYFWLKENSTVQSGVGEVALNSKGAVSLNSINRQVSVWNEFINEFQGETLGSNKRIYNVDGLIFTDYFSGETSGFETVVNFVTKTIPTAKPKVFNGYKNSLL